MCQPRQITRINFGLFDPCFCNVIVYIGFWNPYVNQSLTRVGTNLPCYIGERVVKINPLKRKEILYTTILSNKGATKMTKAETREATQAIAYGQTLGTDYMARALSALIRSARTNKSRDELYALALRARVISNPEFII